MILKRKILLTIFIILLINLIIISTFLISAFNISSDIYSGFITSGYSPGNLTGDTINGSTAGFYQHAAGFLNDSLFSGIHNFVFTVSSPSGSPPTISIISPENKTYLKNTNLALNFTSSNALYVLYNIDGAANTTITDNSTFNTTNGAHTLYLYANNSYGTALETIIFTANNSRFHIHYNNYSGSKRGSSTDFNLSTYEDIQNLGNIILENTDYGLIKFNSAINLTNDFNSGDNELDLDSNTGISSNSIILNSTALPNFNKSATLYLYGLTLTDPRILRDGSACSSTICTEINYSGGILVFNVTSFTNYIADETPTTTTPTTTTTAGGGGGITTDSVFSIDKNKISVSLTPRQVTTENITITNTGSDIIFIKIDNLFYDFVVRGEEIIVLNPGESKTVPFHILARVDFVPDIYLGKIIVSSGSLRKEILISVEVESEGALLDVRAEIDKNYKKIISGENILAQIRLFNLGGEGRKDIYIEYFIKDYEGKEIIKETESLAIETQLTFLKEIKIPKETKTGNYVLYVKATYDGKVASASDDFEIVTSKTTSREKIYIVTIIILLILFSLILYYIIKRGSKKKTERISINRIIKHG